MEAISTDQDLARALEAFVRNVAGDGVRVTFDGGIARLDGSVASPTARTALVDLLVTHEGVAAVDNRLRIDAVAERSVR